MFEGAATAIGLVISPKALLLLAFATAIGSAAAILPGISPPTMMALLLPVTFGMEKYEAFMFLVALMAASGFAGVDGTPCHEVATATGIDTVDER